MKSAAISDNYLFNGGRNFNFGKISMMIHNSYMMEYMGKGKINDNKVSRNL